MTLTQEEPLRELCDEQWPEVNRQVAEALKLPRWETPEPTRRQVNDAFCNESSVRKYDPRKPSDKHLLAQAFRRQALPTAKAAAQATVHVAALVSPKTLAAIRRKLRVEDVSKAEGARPARLQKADARNLEVLSFVVERIIPFGQLFKQRLGKHGRDTRLLPGHRGPKVAVPRQALAEEWNRTYPHDSMSSGDVLMGQYHRAASRPHLTSVLLLQLQAEVNKTAETLWKAGHASQPQPTPELEAQMTVWLESPEASEGFGMFWDAKSKLPELIHPARADAEKIPQRKQRQRERDKLTLSQLLAPFILYHMMYMAGRGIIGKPAGEATLYRPGLANDPRPFGKPLRYWFLEEAKQVPR